MDDIEQIVTEGGLVLRSEEFLTVSVTGQASPLLSRRRVLELDAWP